MTSTLPSLLAAATRARGPYPLLTFSGAGQSLRTELSYATFVNWAAKTANWLTTEHDLERGDRVGVAVTDDWPFLVTVSGCWLAGIGPVLTGDGLLADDDVLAFGDDYDDPDVDAADVAVVVDGAVTTHAELVGAAEHLLPRSGRLVATVPAGVEAVLAFGAAVAAHGALVWCPGMDTAVARRLAAAERATHLLQGSEAVPLEPPR